MKSAYDVVKSLFIQKRKLHKKLYGLAWAINVYGLGYGTQDTIEIFFS